jgi:enamine deaminase RidA (YjgF/YER057c/UK114 family)
MKNCIDSNGRISQMVRKGDIIYFSGQIPNDVSADIKGQATEVLSRIDEMLVAQGGSKTDLVQVQVWLQHTSDFAGFTEAWDAWVDKDQPPARATCGADLISGARGVRIEVIATAHL